MSKPVHYNDYYLQNNITYEKGYYNIVRTPCGSGKTFHCLEFITEPEKFQNRYGKDRDVRKSLYVTDTCALRESVVKDYEMKTGKHVSTEENYSKNLRVITYAKLANELIKYRNNEPAYISNYDDLAPLMQAQVDAGGPVPTDPNHNNDWYGTSKYIEDATGNPLYQRDRRDQYRSGINVRGTVALNLKPLKCLTVTSRLGYRITQSNYHNYEVPFWLNTMSNNSKYTIEAQTNNGLYYQWENFANFMKDFGKHNVSAMVGMSFTKNHWEDWNHGVS